MSHKSLTVEPYITIQMCRHSTNFRYLARKPRPLWTWFILSFPTTHTNIHLSFYLCSFIYWIICCGWIFPKLVFDVRFTIRDLSSFSGIFYGSHTFEKLTLAGFQLFVFSVSPLYQKSSFPFIVFELCQISTPDHISDFVSNPETPLTRNRTKCWFLDKFDFRIKTSYNKQEGKYLHLMNGSWS